MKLLARIVPFVSGVLFSVGLVLAGMTRPSKVIGFLDFSGAWDPSLMMVMVGAIAVYMPVYYLLRRNRAPIFGERFSLPERRDLDARLIGGAAIFGVGWGLAGYCPGPGLTSLGSGATSALVFVGGMLAGMAIYAVADAAAGARPEPGAARS